MRLRAAELFKELQAEICAELERVDGSARFETDEWVRQDAEHSDGGGGVTRILRSGTIFEQAGVNFSEVFGVLPAEMSAKLTGLDAPAKFYATGISLVLHPFSPMVPTTHANFRYLEVESKRWFGGGSDLTPYYLFEEDARHFHRTLKTACDRFGADYYPRFKRECDEYFYIPHRKEARGVGGLFFDYLGRDRPEELPAAFDLVAALGRSFLASYVPIVRARQDEPWGDQEKSFQLLRRGRYVEFNLVYDRGTQFGLKTNGRAESILMSLPPNVRWEYDFKPVPGSREAQLVEVLRTPREWC